MSEDAVMVVEEDVLDRVCVLEERVE